METDEKRTKIAIISGASHALRYKNKKPRASEQEIIQYLTDDMENIIKKIDEEL